MRREPTREGHRGVERGRGEGSEGSGVWGWIGEGIERAGRSVSQLMRSLGSRLTVAPRLSAVGRMKERAAAHAAASGEAEATPDV